MATSNEDLRVLIGDLNHAVQRDNHDMKHHFDARLDAIERHIRKDIHMASVAEQAAIDDIAATVADVATKVDGFAPLVQGFRDQIAAFVAQDTVDAADKAALQAIIDGMDKEVLAQLTPIAAALHAMDDGLNSPATPDAPLSATP